MQSAMGEFYQVHQLLSIRRGLLCTRHYHGQKPLCRPSRAVRIRSSDLSGTKNLHPCFPTTSEIRLVLRQLLDCPPERKLKKLYLEGKVLELLSLFCDEVTGKPKSDKEISKEDHRCLIKARDLIDKNFLHPLTIPQIAQQCFLSETKLSRASKPASTAPYMNILLKSAWKWPTNFCRPGSTK